MKTGSMKDHNTALLGSLLTLFSFP